MSISGHFHVLGMRRTRKYILVLRLETRATSVQSSTLWQQATVEIIRRDHSIIACGRHIYLCVALCAHPICGESHFQCNSDWEVATTYPPFCNESHLSHVLFVKIAPGSTSTAWSKHYAPLCCDSNSWAASVQSFSLWQQTTIEIPRCADSISPCWRHIYTWVLFFTHIPFVMNRTFQHNANRELATLEARLG